MLGKDELFTMAIQLNMLSFSMTTLVQRDRFPHKSLVDSNNLFTVYVFTLHLFHWTKLTFCEVP